MLPYFTFLGLSSPNLIQVGSEMGGLGHDFGHESVSEPVSEADSDSDTRFSQTSDTDWDTNLCKFRNLRHGFGLGHGFEHEFRHELRPR